MHSDSSISKKSPYVAGPTEENIYNILIAASPTSSNQKAPALYEEYRQSLEAITRRATPGDALIYAYKDSREYFSKIFFDIEEIKEILPTLKKKGVELGREEEPKWYDEMEKGLDSLSRIADKIKSELELLSEKKISTKDLAAEPQKLADDLSGAARYTQMYITNLKAILFSVIKSAKYAKDLNGFKSKDITKICKLLRSLVEENIETFKELEIKIKQTEKCPRLDLDSKEVLELSQQLKRTKI